ncbi:GTPase [Nucleospora cyclopteri]
MKLHLNQVPQASHLIDICLSKTNRKTPTVIHPNFEIVRIRNFYIRKIKHCGEEFVTRISNIIKEFPVIEDIHPFYAELISILYDRNTYKIALGKLNGTKNKLLTIQNNSIKMIKFADSLYRCKCLKRSGLGQMATTVNKLKEELKFLENVRQHISRLPTIDPFGRTVIVAGFPNVGKSSFVSYVSKCKSEIQPYAFTTKSLFVGHVLHNDLTYQLIDTPGILDHSLEERNKVEMLSISALAHLKSAVLFFIDISESCGHNIMEQIDLFVSLTPLINSQFIIVLSKVDLVVPHLDEFQSFVESNKVLSTFLEGKQFVCVSTAFDYANFDKAKQMGCQAVLEERCLEKSEKRDGFMHRIQIVRPPVTNKVYEGSHIKANKQNNHNSSVYREDMNNMQYDTIPEIMNGKNIADFVHNEEFARKIAEIGIPQLREFDILSREEENLLYEINSARVSANMKSIFNKRATFTKKGHVFIKEEADMENYIQPNKGNINYNKKVQSKEDRVTDSNPKHLYRKSSNKHARTR